jgi:hypothetical protein
MRLLVALALLAFAAVPAQGQVQPRLRPLGISPVRLSGEGFSPGERVRVRAWVGGHKRTKHVRAGKHGRFRVRFAELSRNPCTQKLKASAVGTKGHDARLERAPLNCESPPDRCTDGADACPPPRAQPSISRGRRSRSR